MTLCTLQDFILGDQYVGSVTSKLHIVCSLRFCILKKCFLFVCFFVYLLVQGVVCVQTCKYSWKKCSTVHIYCTTDVFLSSGRLKWRNPVRFSQSLSFPSLYAGLTVKTIGLSSLQLSLDCLWLENMPAMFVSGTTTTTKHWRNSDQPNLIPTRPDVAINSFLLI